MRFCKVSQYLNFIMTVILRRETFAGKKFREVKISQNFRVKFSPVTSNDAFCDYLTFMNKYFKRLNLVTFRHIQANLFQF